MKIRQWILFFWFINSLPLFASGYFHAGEPPAVAEYSPKNPSYNKASLDSGSLSAQSDSRPSASENIPTGQQKSTGLFTEIIRTFYIVVTIVAVVGGIWSLMLSKRTKEKT